MNIKRIKLADVKPAAYNPRRQLKPGEKEYEALKASISRWSLVEPLVVNLRTGNLVGGHQRHNVLLDLGHTEAEAAGVSVKGVRLLEDGTVFISVSGQKHAEGAGQDSGISVEPVRPVESTKARQEQFVLADGEALKGTAREDLKERFAAVIGIGQTQLEVVEVE